MGLDTLQSRGDRAKLKWWYKLATLPEDQEWNINRYRKAINYLRICARSAVCAIKKNFFCYGRRYLERTCVWLWWLA